VPHEAVHADQAPKAETVQWTGHGPWLHVCVSAVCGHTAPPNVGGTWVRVREWKPLVHDLVQVDQAVKVPTPQLTGHAWSLQERVSAACGQTAPPNVAGTLTRLRLCEPVPHDRVQVDHESKVPMSQSTGQAAPLQLRVSSRYGHA
jgi:hypothetical protein